MLWLPGDLVCHFSEFPSTWLFIFWPIVDLLSFKYVLCLSKAFSSNLLRLRCQHEGHCSFSNWIMTWEFSTQWRWTHFMSSCLQFVSLYLPLSHTHALCFGSHSYLFTHCFCFSTRNISSCSHSTVFPHMPPFFSPLCPSLSLTFVPSLIFSPFSHSPCESHQRRVD